MVWLVLAPVILGVAIYKLPPVAARTLALAGQAVLGFLAVGAWLHAGYEPTFEVLGGDDALLYVTLRTDSISLTLVTLTLLLFAAAVVYVLRASYADNKLLLLLLVLQGLSSGIFIADDVFTLFVLFEVASLVAVLTVMYRKNRRNTYDGLYYLVVQLVAMMFFLFGVAYLYRSFGVLSVTQITEVIAAGVDGRVLVLPFALMLTGVGLKAGLFPLFSYVPHSYGNPGAPSPMLWIMSCVLVKGALFWVYRLLDMFAPAFDARIFLAVVGIITGLLGAAIALAQEDIRLVLAFSTVSQSGLIVLGFAAGSTTATAGALLHLVTHALAKAVLFLIAARMIRWYGTARLGEIRGVGRRMPFVATLAALAMLNMVGAPFTGGAVSKDMMLLGATGWIEAAMWAVNIGTILVMVRLGLVMFGTSDAPTRFAAWRRLPDRFAIGVIFTAVSATIAIFATDAVDLITGYYLEIQFWPGAVKVATFIAMLTGALLAHSLAAYRVSANALERLRGPLNIALSLPQAALMLTVFFASALIFATTITRGGGT